MSSRRANLRNSQDPRLPTTDHSSKDVDSNYRGGSKQKKLSDANLNPDPETKKKNDASKMAVDYDKVRYPGYKDLIYRRRNQEYLPSQVSKVTRMLGLGGPVEMGGRLNVLEENRSSHIRFDCDFECGNIDQVR